MQGVVLFVLKRRPSHGARRHHAVELLRAERAADAVGAPEPRRHLAVLTTSVRLRDAVQRAALFERAVAARPNDRATRYEAMLATRLPSAHYDNACAVPKRQSDAQPRPAA
jgi:hypothetical protein